MNKQQLIDFLTDKVWNRFSSGHRWYGNEDILAGVRTSKWMSETADELLFGLDTTFPQWFERVGDAYATKYYVYFDDDSPAIAFREDGSMYTRSWGQNIGEMTSNFRRIEKPSVVKI